MNAILVLLLAALTAAQVIKNCHIQDVITNLCITCQPGYTGPNGTCDDCDVGYTRKNQKCEFIQKTTIPLVVTQTLPGFIVIQNPCTAINSKQECVGCISGYTLTNGICLENAASANGQSGSTSTAAQTSSTNSSSSPVSSQASANINMSNSSSSPSSSVFNSTVLPDVMHSSSIPSTVTLVGTTSTSQGCCQYDQNTLACKKCSFSYHQDLSSTEFKCLLNDPLCKSYTAAYTCQSCFTGYFPLNGKCIIMSVGSALEDPYCKTLASGVCQECYSGYYVSNLTNKCAVANSACKTRDSNNKCQTCYDGYSPINGNCIPTATSDSTINVQPSITWTIFYPFLIPLVVSNPAYYQDSNCKKFENGTCTECSFRTYPSNGICQQVDPNCKDYNKNNGQCSSCYKGYLPNNGSCLLVAPSSSSSVCPYRTVPINGFCIKVSDQCKKWDASTALCTDCYLGYTKVNGTCSHF